MGNTRFSLKEKNAERATLIFLNYNYKGIRFKYSTGEKIHPDDWDEDNYRTYAERKRTDLQFTQRMLDMIEKEFEQVIFYLKYHNIEITKENLKHELDTRLNKTKKKIIPDLETYMTEFIEDCENGKRLTPKGLKYKDWTVKGFKTTKFHITEYQDKKNIQLKFDDITLKFYEDFVNYFQGNKASTNTIGKHIKNLKTVMKSATDEGLNTNLDFQKKKFKTIYEIVDKIYLSESELEAMYKKDLSNNPSLDRARDLFILASQTGLRFADLSKITKDRIVKNDKGAFLTVFTEKTNEKVIIPLKKASLAILNKYKFEVPRVITNQRLNDYIKKVGKAAGIKELVESSITKGGEVQTETHKKFELITTHTARRSFATNMYLAGIPAISIMKFTGHRTETSFLKYIRISSEDNAYKIAEHPYFNT